MKIKSSTRSVRDPERLLDCTDALKPYVYAVLKMVDKAPSSATVPEYRQIMEAAREAGWDEVAITAAIDMLVVSYLDEASTPAPPARKPRLN